MFSRARSGSKEIGYVKKHLVQTPRGVYVVDQQCLEYNITIILSLCWCQQPVATHQPHSNGNMMNYDRPSLMCGSSWVYCTLTQEDDCPKIIDAWEWLFL